MKTKLGKLIYMGLGALIAFLGYMLGTMNDNINAQSGIEQVDVDEIVIQKLRVVDTDGNTIAVLGKQELSEGKRIDVLQVYDASGNIVLHLGQTSNGGIIDVHGKDRSMDVLLTADADGGKVVVSGKDGNPGVLLTADADGGKVVVFGRDVDTTKDVDTAAVLQADANAANVTLLGKDKERGLLGITADGGQLELSDKNGNVSVFLNSTADGGSVSVVDKDGKSAAILRPDTTVVRVIGEQRHRTSIRPPTIRWIEE